MKITGVQTDLFRVPPAVHWEDATHAVSGLEFVTVTIITDADLTGVGFAYTVGVGGSAIKMLIDDYMAQFLLGRDPGEIEALWNELHGHLHRTGRGGLNTLALAATDVALWDLRAKGENLPLYKVLGAARDRVPAYASGIDFHLTLDDLLSLVEAYLAEGYRAVKIKVGREDPEEDRERVRAIRKLIGPQRLLLLDANQKWRAADAVQRIVGFQEFRPGWIEEPITCEDVRGHARIRSACQVPVAIGESLYGKRDFADYVEANAVDIFQPDVARVGGVTEWLKIAHLADAFHLPVAPHFLAELSCHLLCAVPNGMILENVKGGTFGELRVVEEALLIRDGYAYPPQRPGHGVCFDWEALSKYRIRPGDLQGVDVRTRKG